MTAVAWVFLVVVVAAFSVVVFEAWSKRIRLAAVLTTASCSLLIAVAGPLLLSRDVYTYAAYGRIEALYGGNPYLTDSFGVPARSLRRRDFRAVATYPLALRSAVHTGKRRPRPCVGGFDGSNDPRVQGARRCLDRGSHGSCGTRRTRIRPERAALAAALVGLNPVIVVHTVGGGHVDALIAAPLAAACALVATRPPARSARAFAITILITLACLIKTVILPVLLLWFAWLARPRAVRALSFHLLVVAALTVATAGAFFSASHPWAPFASLGGIEFWASPSHFVARGAQTFVGGGCGHARRTQRTRRRGGGIPAALRRPPVATRSTSKGCGRGTADRGVGDRTVPARVVASVPPSVVCGVVRPVPRVLRGRRAHIRGRLRLCRARIHARSCGPVSRLDDARSDGRSPLRRCTAPPSRSRRQRGAHARAPAGRRRRRRRAARALAALFASGSRA